jgi:SAM-dependent methyltransferase
VNERNRALWEIVNEQFTDADAAAAWCRPVITWGLFQRAEHELATLGDVSDAAVLDLCCGTGYFSAWLARAGARPVALDLSRSQLTTAQRLQEAHGERFPLVEADGGRLPLRDNSFELVVSEHGAAAWCDPSSWVPEAARVLRPGGRLVFLTNSVLSALCVPEDSGPAVTELQRAQRGLSPVAWPGGGVEHHPSHGDWIRHLRGAGLVVEALHELYPDEDAAAHPFYEIVTPEWARQWPAEELWVARLE